MLPFFCRIRIQINFLGHCPFKGMCKCFRKWLLTPEGHVWLPRVAYHGQIDSPGNFFLLLFSFLFFAYSFFCFLFVSYLFLICFFLFSFFLPLFFSNPSLFYLFFDLPSILCFTFLFSLVHAVLGVGDWLLRVLPGLSVNTSIDTCLGAILLTGWCTT